MFLMPIFLLIGPFAFNKLKITTNPFQMPFFIFGGRVRVRVEKLGLELKICLYI